MSVGEASAVRLFIGGALGVFEATASFFGVTGKEIQLGGCREIG
jgi:hypothetical protein